MSLGFFGELFGLRFFYNRIANKPSNIDIKNGVSTSIALFVSYQPDFIVHLTVLSYSDLMISRFVVRFGDCFIDRLIKRLIDVFFIHRLMN